MTQSAKNSSGKEVKKLLLLGLDNSGKSSILLSLTRHSNLLNFLTLAPTHGIDRLNYEENGKIFNLWDFGGQEQYRVNHLKELDKYLVGIDKLFFVIDIQDNARYDSALDYLEKILAKIKNHDEPFEFTIFLHKYDPNIHELNASIDDVLINDLIPRIKNLIDPSLTYQIYKTSIYTMFQKELVY